MQISKYQMGWIGLRVEKRGNATKLLKKNGWRKVGHADINNRNGFDFIKPCVFKENWLQFDFGGFCPSWPSRDGDVVF